MRRSSADLVVPSKAERAAEDKTTPHTAARGLTGSGKIARMPKRMIAATKLTGRTPAKSCRNSTLLAAVMADTWTVLMKMTAGTCAESSIHSRS